jgi:hypothetical protein
MRRLALCLLLILALPAAAQDTGKKGCDNYRLEQQDAAAMPRLAKISEAIVEQFCAANLPSRAQLSAALLGLLDEAVAEFERLGIDERILALRPKVAEARKSVDAGHEAENIARHPSAPGVRFSTAGALAADEPQCNEKVSVANKAGKTSAKDCQQLMDGFQAIYAHAQFLVQRNAGQQVTKYLNLVQKDWDDFFVKSRSQTTLELLVNSYLWAGDKVAGSFLQPPERQLILLHPSVVIEHASGAASGNRQKEGVMLEWAGANWWRREKWYQLSGASLVSIYSDRAGVNDWGHGAALHFGNKFTVGLAMHSGKRGIFVSLDVLDLIKEKRTLIDAYIGRVKEAAAGLP